MIYAAVVAFILSQTQANQFDTAIEDAAYLAIKHGLILEGYTETQADCIVNVLKLQGTTNDVSNVRNVLTPEETLQKLKNKMNFSISFCENGPLIACLVALAFVILCCCCICCCCCRSKQPATLRMPNTIQLSVPFYSNGVQAHPYPYDRMDRV